MRKLKLFFACLLMAVLSIGQMWGAEQLAYTLTPAAGTNNSYAGNCDVTISGITWNVTGNASLTPWRLGGKSLSGVDRAVYSKTAMSDAITKVELTVGAASSITVNSLKLVVASNADFSSVIDEVTGTFAANSTITFKPTSPATQWATGAYYKFIFNVSVSGTSNKFVAFTEAKFYKEVATATCETPTFSPAAGTFFGEQEITITTNTAGASIYYTTDGTTPSSSNGTLYDDPFSIDETTTIKAIAVKAGATDSPVAEATFTAGTPVSSFDIDFETNNLAAYVNWNFVNIASTTTTITAYAGTYYGKTSGTASASITTKAKYANPGLLTFYTSKESGNTTASSWIAQVSEDGEVWTEVATFDATTGNKGTWTAREADLSGHTDVYIRIAYSGSTAIRAIDNISLANAAEIAKPAISGDESFLTSTEVEITCSTGGVTIYYTNDGTDPKTSGTKKTYSSAFDVTSTTTIRAIANLGAAWSAEATSKTFTKITPITVAAAIAAIPNKDDVVNDQYVSGIVCTAGTSVNASGQMTYYISADGSEGTRLQIYLGKNINNTAFSSASDLAIGDRVVVFGQLKNYKGTYEMNSGNYLASKESPAVATPVFDPNGGGFMGETDVTITCATASSTIYYTLDGTTPTKLSNVYNEPIHINATTTITAIAYVGEEHSIVVAKEFTLTAPMTVAEACAALDTQDPINNAAVAGIVYNVTNISAGHATYWISDDGTDTGDVLEVYNGYGLNGAAFAAGGIQEGDEVTVFGNLTIFTNTSTKEFAAGSRLLTFNRPVVAVTSIDLTESTAEVEVGKTVTLHASVVPANATNKTIVWSVQSGNDYASVDENGVVTGIAAGEAVIRAASDENASIYEECTVTVTEPAPLSPWASVYTSNVTIASNEEKQVTIDGKDYDAAKTNKGTSATITLPQGVTTLHLHLVAWKGEAQTVTVSGDCFNEDKELTILANDAVAGTVAKYDLGASGVDYYFSLTPDNAVAADEVITISAAGGKRFVLFGVNQEGGIVPVLQSLALSGDLENKTYEAGAAINPAGLTVMGTYTLGGVAQTPVDVTDQVEDWLYDALQAGDEAVTISAKIGTVTSNSVEISGLTVTDPTPRFETNPASYISFGSKEQGATITARDLVVTLINVNTATVEISGTGAAAFSVDEDVLDGNATIHVSASSANVGTFNATLTISDDEGVATDKEISLSLTITAPVVEETAVSTTSKWVVATAADLVDGAEVLITGVKDDVTYAIGVQNDNNRAAVAGTLEDDVFTPGENTMSFTLVAQETEGVFALQASNGEYLYAASSAKNYLKRQATLDDNAKWTLTVTSAVANGSNTHNDLKFNATNSPKIFSCYTGGQTAIQFYVPKPADPEPQPEVIRNGLEAGKWGTICPTQNISEVEGATFYQIAYLEELGGVPYNMVFDEIEGTTLTAGKPYFFIASASEIRGIKAGAVLDAADPDGVNGFYGYIGAAPMHLSYLADYNPSSDNTFVIYDNSVFRITGATDLKSERCYININSTEPSRLVSQPAPGRRRINMAVTGTNVATGIDAINASEKPMKLMIDGQIYILRGEKLFDTTGRLVK